jgi:hypothetical protein
LAGLHELDVPVEQQMQGLEVQRREMQLTQMQRQQLAEQQPSLRWLMVVRALPRPGTVLHHCRFH